MSYGAFGSEEGLKQYKDFQKAAKRRYGKKYLDRAAVGHRKGHKNPLYREPASKPGYLKPKTKPAPIPKKRPSNRIYGKVVV